MKKYKLTNEAITQYGQTLYRIQALKSFNDVKAGDLGGFVETEENLIHEGNCWVYDNARVYSYARVGNSALVCGYAQVYGSAQVYGDAWMYNLETSLPYLTEAHRVLYG